MGTTLAVALRAVTDGDNASLVYDPSWSQGLLLHSSGCTKVMPLPVKPSISGFTFVTLPLLKIKFEIKFHYSLRSVLKETKYFQYIFSTSI